MAIESSESVVDWIVMGSGAAVITFLGWLFRKDKDMLDGLSTRMTVVENNYVKDSDVRGIVKMEFTPLVEELHEVKKGVLHISEILSDMQVKSAKEAGWKEAMKEVGRRREDDLK